VICFLSILDNNSFTEPCGGCCNEKNLFYLHVDVGVDTPDDGLWKYFSAGGATSRSGFGCTSPT
jgi:hypothetical protein